jgi:hypothetical protein
MQSVFFGEKQTPLLISLFLVSIRRLLNFFKVLNITAFRKMDHLPSSDKE